MTELEKNFLLLLGFLVLCYIMSIILYKNTDTDCTCKEDHEYENYEKNIDKNVDKNVNNDSDVKYKFCRSKCNRMRTKSPVNKKICYEKCKSKYN